MSYVIPPDDDKHPARMALRLLQLPEFGHLVDGDAVIDYLYRTHPEDHQGRHILGTCSIPMVQGRNRELFEWLVEERLGRVPDFLVILDWEYWEDADYHRREILLYHELCHARQKVNKHGLAMFDPETGKPQWAIRGHDVEEFDAVVRRYGAHSEDLRSFLDACAEGDENLARGPRLKVVK